MALSFPVADDAPQQIMDAYRQKIWDALLAHARGDTPNLKFISEKVLLRNETYLQQFFGKKASPRYLPEKERRALAAYISVPEDSLRPDDDHSNLPQSALVEPEPGDIALLQYPTPIPPMARDLQVLGTVVAGRGDDADVFMFNGQVNEYQRRPAQLNGVNGAYAVYIHGESMIPAARDGQMAFVHPHRPPRAERLCVVELTDHRGYVKEFVKRTPTRLIVKQYNPEKKLEFPLDSVKSCHYVLLVGDPD